MIVLKSNTSVKNRRARNPFRDPAHGERAAVGPDFGREHVALRVYRDTLARHALGPIGFVRVNHISDAPVADAPNANAALPARIVARSRFRVRDVEDAVLVDVHIARPAELIPRVEVLSVLIEDLHTVVAAVGDE